jgi:hypothetical protein
MLEFEIDGKNFKVEKLSAKKQWHLSRKLAPLLPPLAPLFLKAGNLKGKSATDLLAFVEMAEPFAEALSTMKDADADALFDLALEAVKIETSPGQWMPVMIRGADVAPVIELNDFDKLLPIILRVIVFNLGGFISGFLTSREEPQEEQNGGTSPTTKTG